MNNPKPKLTLVGYDGNAFSILGRARRAAQDAGWDPETVKRYTDEATGGDYDNLLRVTIEYFDVS
jgi:hypothetical protein